MNAHPRDAAPDELAVLGQADALDLELAEIDGLLPFIAHSLEPIREQRPSLRPKPTPAENARRKAQHEAERRDQLDNERRRLPIPGRSPAPLSIEAVDVAVTVSSALIAIEHRLWKHARSWPLDERHAHRTDRARLRRIRRHLKRVDDPAVLRAMYLDAMGARREAELLIYGELRLRLNARCPYCHRETLVVYARDPRATKSKSKLDERTPTETIRCDKGPDEDCYCSSETCPCKREKFGGRQTYRHSWTRDRGGWDALAALMAKHEKTCRQCKPVTTTTRED
jgi:hypothetical protein